MAARYGGAQLSHFAGFAVQGIVIPYVHGYCLGLLRLLALEDVDAVIQEDGEIDTT